MDIFLAFGLAIHKYHQFCNIVSNRMQHELKPLIALHQSNYKYMEELFLIWTYINIQGESQIGTFEDSQLWFQISFGASRIAH